MSLTTILSELWRFIKDNFIKILVGAILTSILAVLVSLFLPNLMGQTTSESPEEEQLTQLPPDEDAQASRDYLIDRYEEEPAVFEVFIQLEDGNVFGNSFIFDEYFTSSAIVEEIERETGVDYGLTLDHEKNLELYKTSQYRGSIAGIRNTSTNVITIRVQAAESGEENLILAEAFADRIVNNDIPFMQELSVTLMSEPAVGEKLIDGALEMVSSPEALGILSPATSENQSIILYAIAGFILGVFLVATVLFIIQLFKKKINYAFQYSWDFDDYHFIYSTDESSDKLTETLLAPETMNQLIVHQDQESSLIDSLTASNYPIETTLFLSRHAQNDQDIDEILLLIESKKTDKIWFNEQYRLAEKYETQITIIQIIQ